MNEYRVRKYHDGALVTHDRVIAEAALDAACASTYLSANVRGEPRERMAESIERGDIIVDLLNSRDDEKWLREEHETLGMSHVPFQEFLENLALSYSPYEGYNMPHHYVDAARRVLSTTTSKEQQ